MSEQLEKNKRISVSIGGISYQLISQENESYAREIARKADDTIHQIIQQHPSLSTTQAIVLAMVNMIDALTKLGNSLDEAKKEIERIEEKSSKEIQSAQFNMTKAQHELFSLRDTDFELKKEIIRVNELNKQLELEIASLQKKQNALHHGHAAFEFEATRETLTAVVEKATDNGENEVADDRPGDGVVFEPGVQNNHCINVLSNDAGYPSDTPETLEEQEDSKEEPFGSQDKYEEAEKLRESIENEEEAESLLDFQEDSEDVEYADEPQHPGNPEDGIFPENEFIHDAGIQEEAFLGYKQTSLEEYFV